jgi:hypothetical protein
MFQWLMMVKFQQQGTHHRPGGKAHRATLKRNVKTSRRVYRSLRQLTLRSNYVVAMALRTAGTTTATCLFIQGGEHPPLA